MTRLPCSFCGHEQKVHAEYEHGIRVCKGGVEEECGCKGFAKDTHPVFKILIGQVWERKGKFFHVPRQEKNQGVHHWEMIRCIQTAVGFRWVHPRVREDEPVWSLGDFQNAVLVEDPNEAKD